MTTEKQKEYYRKYYQKNKEKINARSKKWVKEHPEKMRENYKKWCINNPEKSNESRKKAIDKFKDKVSWNEYCYAAKQRRYERLKKAGVVNAWSVISRGVPPIYEEDNNAESTTRG